MKSTFIVLCLLIFGLSFAQSGDDNLPKPVSSKNEKSPEFPGGIANFNKLAQQKFDRKSVECRKGVLSTTVNFLVDKDGSVVDVKATGSNKDLNAEAIKAVLSVTEKWTPGSVNGENVRTYFALPFKLNCD